MALGLDILGGLGTLSESVANIWTSGDKVEIAKYQADIAASQATVEEKKYAMQLADQRLKQLASDEASKKKNQTLLYVGVGFGSLLLLLVVFMFSRKPSPKPVQAASLPQAPLVSPTPPSLQGVHIPKPKKLV